MEDSLSTLLPEENRIPTTWERGDRFTLENDKIYVVSAGLVMCQRIFDDDSLMVQMASKGQVLAFPDINNQYPPNMVATVFSKEAIVTAFTVNRIDDPVNLRIHATLYLELLLNMEYITHVRHGSEAQLVQRIPAWLLYLAPLFPRNAQGHPTIILTQEELAQLLGARRETVSAALRAMRDEELIDTRYRKIIITSEQALRDRAGSLSFILPSMAPEEEEELLVVTA
jgi:CRP-like cAMP-binding protein